MAVRAGPLLAAALLLVAGDAAALLASLAPASPAVAHVVGLREEAGPDDRARLLRIAPTLRFLASSAAAVGDLTPTQASLLARDPLVDRVTPVASLELHLDRSKPLLRADTPLVGLGYTGRGVTVAVVDSGVDPHHPDLSGRVAANLKLVGSSFVAAPGDPDGHGTHVAGIVAGTGSASGGRLAGVAPGARVVGLDISGAFNTAGALEAFDWLFLNHEELGIRVVVNAWGRAARGERFDPADPVVRAADRLVRAGVVVLFSASNHGPDPATLSLEAQNPNVLTIGATDDAGVVASWSSRGPALAGGGGEAGWVKPDFVAPGASILSARSTGSPPPAQAATLSRIPAAAGEHLRYRELTGTSQSVPHVAGVIACMLEANPALSPAAIANLLRETAVDVGALGPDPAAGFGLVDAHDAVAAAAGLPPDRANAILAGGVETYRAEGEVLGTGGAVQVLPSVAVGESGVRVPFPAKPGATRARFVFEWTPPAAAAYRLYLTNGEETLGPWGNAEEGPDGSRLIRGEADLPASGEWALLARGPTAGHAGYRAEIQVVVAGDPDRALPLDPRYRIPDGDQGWVEAAAARARYEWDALEVRARRAARGWSEIFSEHPVAAAAGLLAGAASLLALGVLAARRAKAGARREDD